MTSACPAPQPSTRFHRIWTVIAVILSIAAVLPWLVDAGPSLRFATDIEVYRAGAAALLDGDNLYTRSYEVGDITLPFTYPPLAAILFIPLALIPYPVALVTWTVASVVLLWWCLLIVLRHAAPGTTSPHVLATWVLPFALVTEPVRETLAFGQINILLMALVLADTLAKRPWLPRGVLIGLAAAVKLTPAVFILVFLVRREWRHAAVTFFSGVGFTLIAAALSWRNSWTYWLDTLTDTGRIGGESYASNQSIRGVLARLGERGETASSLLWIILVLLALGLIFWAMMRADSLLWSVLLASTVALVCSPVSWSHHWVWLIPVALALGVTPGLLPRLFSGVVLLAVFTSPHWLLPNSDGVEHDWPWWAQAFGSSYLVVTLAVVVAAVVAPGALTGRRESALS